MSNNGNGLEAGVAGPAPGPGPNGNSVFSDFCQAWVARFPGSELPAAWEEDVRANLKKHRTKVAILREELEKEEMYVEYLDKLLVDIERHRKSSTSSISSFELTSTPTSSSSSSSSSSSNGKKAAAATVSVKNSDELSASAKKTSSASSSPPSSSSHSLISTARTQMFLDEHLEKRGREGNNINNNRDSTEKKERSSLHLDLGDRDSVSQDKAAADEHSFVTVISVSSPTADKSAGAVSASKGNDKEADQNAPGSNLTFTKNSKGVKKERKIPPRPPPKRHSGSRDSLNSVSSPTTPTSPLLSSTEDFPGSPREGINTLSPKDPLLQTKLSSSSEETVEQQHDLDADYAEEEEQDEFDLRGRPDGRDNEDHQRSVRKSSNSVNDSCLQRQSSQQQQQQPTTPSGGSSKVNKIKELMANWETKPLVGPKPVVPVERSASAVHLRQAPASSPKTKRNDSDSSSRGRMGSPSGKSHDSSDSETNNSWSRRDGSPSAARRRVSGETRLDRLVRRPSGGGGAAENGKKNGARHSESLPAPALPKAVKKPKAKPRSVSKDPEDIADEPLYDTVANDEPEDEYDNHLLYGTSSTSKTDTIGSSGGGSSSADLGFDEPRQNPLKSAQSGLSLTGSGTLSSSGSSPSLKRGMSIEEEEGNYVNIQYFLQRQPQPRPANASSSSPSASASAAANASGGSAGAMGTIHSDDEDENSSDKLSSSREMLDDVDTASETERIQMYKCILNSIVDSEAMYLECLSVMLQYMKAMKVTLSTAQPVIPKEDFDVIFFKVPDLHELHFTFHDSLKRQVNRWTSGSGPGTIGSSGGGGGGTIGQTFKMLASRTKIYAAFLNNYQKALESLHRCTETYPQFADLTRSIKLRTVKGQGQTQGQTLSLEDLLHKPVARVQKHCLCLQDLIKYTPESHPDFKSLNEALTQVQSFVSEYNTMHAGELFPHQERQQRHLVKNSFIVELSESQRKLRHLFLFNDVLVCAKYKASSSGSKNNGEKFTFQLKWFIPLSNALIVEEPSTEPKESSPANLLSLKTQTSALRDQIHRIEKEESWKGGRRSSNGTGAMGGVSKSAEKLMKKLAELEAQLVLASPSLLFQVAHKHGAKPPYSFFLSSEYERSQWVETLQVLQANLPHSSGSGVAAPSANKMTMYELQAWITGCRKFLKTNMGSFLMRSPRDEALLVGDLHFRVHQLQGLTRPADLFVVVEVDSYGHYFRKSKTKLICQTMDPVWDEEFIVELEGSENLRILVYEQQSTGNLLRGRATLELSRTWLTSSMSEQRISMNDVVLTCSMKYVTFEETIRRVPHSGGGKSSSAGLFGAPIKAITKREKRAVPFIITSCVREVERRGISEVGIYRVSGSAVDVTRLKKAYEHNPYEAEQLLKDCDIHSVAGTLKLFLRDLPESLFTTPIYKAMFEAYQEQDQELRRQAYLGLFSQIPQNPNQACVVFLVEHMVRVSQYEQQNKMSLHNLATVFGPTLLQSGDGGGGGGGKKGGLGGGGSRDQLLTTGTVDVMAQAGILHFFLSRRARGEPIQIVERQV